MSTNYKCFTQFEQWHPKWALWGILWWLSLGRYRGNQMSIEYILHLCFPCNMNQFALIWGSTPVPCLVTRVWCVRGGSCFLWKDDFRCPVSFGLLFQCKISGSQSPVLCCGLYSPCPHVPMLPCCRTLCFADMMYLHVCMGIAWALEQCAFLLQVLDSSLWPVSRLCDSQCSDTLSGGLKFWKICQEISPRQVKLWSVLKQAEKISECTFLSDGFSEARNLSLSLKDFIMMSYRNAFPTQKWDCLSLECNWLLLSSVFLPLCISKCLSLSWLPIFVRPLNFPLNWKQYFMALTC